MGISTNQIVTSGHWNRILIEGILFAIVVVVFAAILSEFDAFEKLHDYTRDHEQYELDEIIIALLVLPVFLMAFTIRRLFDLNTEVRRRTEAERESRDLAETDALTGLPNRRRLFKEIARRSAMPQNSTVRFALLSIDLDRFKQINDTLGPLIGDAILKQTARLLKSKLRRSDMIARIDGDEFVIVAEFEKEQEIEGLAARLLAALNRPVKCHGIECTVGASIGVAVHRDGHLGAVADPGTLLTNADIALYRAKRNGRNRYELFHPALRIAFEAQAKLTDDMIAATTRREFFPLYQPIIDARAQRVAGAEALVRWRHPERGVLAPSQFMDLAKSLKVIDEIDQLMLVEAVRTQARWTEKFGWGSRISVNVSAERLTMPQFITKLEEAGVKPGALNFEISEAVLFDALDETSRRNLQALGELGIDVEIDDFGSGRASILSLLEMRPRRLKIDRNLVAPIVRSAQSRLLVKSIIDLAHSLAIEVLAEGVETAEHARILTDQGCELLQGFAFARPMPLAEFEYAFLADKPPVRIPA
ncbi:MAG: EAL domain-containing protein [Roseibium sp.]|nr:EAL domain-containing protein [Roseibium sp.]